MLLSTAAASASLSVGIVGSGPGSVYCALRLLRKIPNVRIKFYEQHHQNFGLVRWGVSPDNIPVKNVAKKFTAQLEEGIGGGRVRFVNGVRIESLHEPALQKHDCVVVGVGAPHDRQLKIEGEARCLHRKAGLFPSSAVVGWYTGHPLADAQTSEALAAALAACRHLCVVGNGNVALDICRLLIIRTSLTLHRAPDMPPSVMHHLKNACTHLQRITVCGRRGPFQAAFGLAELRDLLRCTAQHLSLIHI